MTANDPRNYTETVGTVSFGPVIVLSDLVKSIAHEEPQTQVYTNKKMYEKITLVVSEGKYICKVQRKGSPFMDGKISKIGIYKEGITIDDRCFKEGGSIVVDNHSAGFFCTDRKDVYQTNLTEKEIQDRARKLKFSYKGDDFVCGNDCFYSKSGLGNGTFSVKTHSNLDRVITAVEIIFC